MRSLLPIWLSGLFLCICTYAFAQFPLTEYYSFQKDTGKYVTLDTAKMQSISDGDVWVEDDVYQVPIPFKFRFLDQYLTYIKTNQTNLFLPERNYFLATFGNFLMYDRGNGTDPVDTVFGLSPISYVIDSSSGSKIMKIQWLNAGFFFDSSMYLNVQVWLYEKSNNIEIRYGKSNIDMKRSQVIGCGPLVGMAIVDTLAGLDKFEYFLRNNAENPEPVELNVTSGKKCLNNVPPGGTIYRFIFRDSAKVVDLYPKYYNVYPNPTRGKLKVDLTDEGPYTISVMDMMGKKVWSSAIIYGDDLDLTHFRNGLYLVNIYKESIVYTQKILLAR